MSLAIPIPPCRGRPRHRRRVAALPSPGLARRARPQFEWLEDRTLLSAITVMNTLDDGSVGSLRWAVEQANAGGGAETINFDPARFNTPQTITLTRGQLELSDPTGTETITGPAAGLTVSGGGQSRVFQVDKGATASISGVTITAGNAGGGGGLENYGTTTLTNCTITGNAAANGGGLNNLGTATLNGCTISNNAATGGNYYGGDGGGLQTFGGTLTLTNCTVSGNHASKNGGGLYLNNLTTGGTTTLTNCTLSGNSAGSGGGVDNESGTATFGNTIVAENMATTGPDAYGAFTSRGNNLIGETDGSSGWVGSDRTGTGAAPLEALLAPLGHYGGLTPTMALLPGSPAIDAGNNALIPAGVTTDQRGLPRIVNGKVNIGAFESSGFTLAYTSGSGQTAGAFAPLVVTVAAHNPKEPVAGGLATFTPPGSGGASAELTGDPATLSAGGTASVTATSDGVAGSYTVSATANGALGAASFRLTNVALVSIAVSPADPELPEGLWEPLTATGTYADGSTADITRFVTWASATPAVATISGTGAASAQALGTTAITASRAGVTSPADTLTVIAPISFVVSNTGDSGPGSLRQAILDSNAATGSTNTIDFNISGPGVQTIALLSPLPTITNPVRIDGESQPGYSGTPLIELNGSQAGSGDGLLITAPNVTIRGLDINQFSQGAGIHLTGTGATGDWIDSNFLGTDAIGTLAVPNDYGVEIDGGASGNLIGSNGDGINDAAERNLISGNQYGGVWIDGQGTDGNAVAGNFIGTSVTGDVALNNGTVNQYFYYPQPAEGGVVIDGGASGNRIGTDGNSVDDVGQRNVIEEGNAPYSGNFDDVLISGTGTDGNVVAGNFIGTDATGTIALAIPGCPSNGVAIKGGASGNWVGVNPIGGTAVADEGNVISGNIDADRSGGFGVEILGSNGNIVAGNQIGTDLTGTQALGNLLGGVDLDEGASNNTIGGVAADAGNLITSNGGPGVGVGYDASDLCIGDQITGNRIFGNIGQAIDLGEDGVTDNGTSPRQGPNNLQNFPVFVLTAAGQTEGSLGGSTPNTTFRLEFFASAGYGPGGSGEAQVNLGSLEVTTNASGQVSFAVPFTAPAGLPILTATATDPQGNTSELTALRPGTLQAPSLSLRAVANQSLALATQSGDGIAIEDPEAEPVNPVWGLTLSVSDGTLTLSSTAGLTGSGDGTGSLAYRGPLAALNAALKGLIFHPPAGAHVFATVAFGAQSFGAQPLPTEQFVITDGVVVVDTTADSGPGSLRQAILDANRVSGLTVTIDFAIPGAGVQTIAPLTPLPAIAASVLVDGTSQPGFAGAPRIAVSAAPAGGPAALTIAGADVTVRGLAVDQFAFVASSDLILVAQVAPLGLTTQLSLLDAQGQVLVQSDGLSSSDRDDLIAQQVVSGSYILKVDSTGGAGTYTLTTTVAPTTAAFQPLPVGSGPSYYIVAGDFSGNGRTDLVVSDAAGTQILLSNGDGTFQPAKTIAPGIGALVAGDFTGDGHLDLAVANARTVSVLLGNGDGTFQPQVTYAVGSYPGAIVAGDFTGDGRLDLVVSDGDGIQILLGNGDGTFQTATTIAPGIGGYLVAGDFTGDGHLDLATANGGDNTVSVLLGNGDGTFQPQVKYAVGSGPSAIVAGNFSGHGHLDLAVTNGGNGADTVSVLLGNGDGTFQPQVTYAVGGNPMAIVAGDFSGNGRIDLAVANTTNSTVSVLLGNGDGTFQPQVTYAAGDLPVAIVAGDFSGDGHLDLAFAYSGDGADPGDVTILPGNGDGTFQPEPGTGIAVGRTQQSWRRGTSLATAGPTWPSLTKTTQAVTRYRCY